MHNILTVISEKTQQSRTIRFGKANPQIENSQQPSSAKYNKITALKYKLNQILSLRISRAFTFMKQKFFEFGDKPHNLMARQIRKLENERTIHKIQSKNGFLHTSPQKNK